MEVTVGDNKTIVEMVDGNVKEVHYYNNEIIKIIIKKPVCIKTNINIENITFTNNTLGKSLYSSDGYFSGNIDDFRIYNFVLTSTQVQELYNGRIDIYSSNITNNIYITRKNERARRISNEDELIYYLSKLGFEMIDPGQLDFFEQVNYFKNAEYIVSAHGAA
jgi:hypothetical protein